MLELLVVIGIIVLLMVLLLSGLNRAREMGRRAQCLTNIRQLTQAWQAYAAANDGMLCNSVGNPQWLLFDPQSSLTQWSTPVDHDPVPLIPNGQLWPYIKDRRVYVCPADPQEFRNTSPTLPAVYQPAATGTSYTMNYLIGFPQRDLHVPIAISRIDRIRNASQRMVFFECNDGWVFDGWFNCAVNSFHPSTSGSIGVIAISFADGHAIMWTLNGWGSEKRNFASANQIDNDQIMTWLQGGPAQ
jgi:type II secretory pathway pseudopilin PulG